MKLKSDRILILWDIDGTLLLTGGAGAVAFDRVFFDLYGIKNIWQNINPDGRTDPSIIDELFIKKLGRLPNLNERKKVYDLYNSYMEEEIPKSERFRLMPKSGETLMALSRKPHVTMGLATGNFKLAAEYKLKQAGFLHYFAFGGYGCDADIRQDLTAIALQRGVKHLGENPTEVYLVGDTIHDVRCGQGIGAKTIAVCTGSTPRSQLEAENADWVIDDLSEFPLY